jgi:hypothetical protein
MFPNATVAKRTCRTTIWQLCGKPLIGSRQMSRDKNPSVESYRSVTTFLSYFISYVHIGNGSSPHYCKENEVLQGSVLKVTLCAIISGMVSLVHFVNIIVCS